MAQEAYDFARFESAERAPTQTRAARLRSVNGGKRKAAAQPKAFGNIAQIALAIIFFATAFALVQSEARLTEYTQQIQSQQSALLSAQSEYSYLESTLNASINLDQVEKVANELGLVKVDESQITYIRLEDEAVLTTTESIFEQWKATLQGIWEQVLTCLDP